MDTHDNLKIIILLSTFRLNSNSKSCNLLCDCIKRKNENKKNLFHPKFILYSGLKNVIF